jgi:hypothetical protein
MNVLIKSIRKSSFNQDYSIYEYPRLVRQDAECHLMTYSEQTSFDEEEFYNGYKTILQSRRNIRTLKQVIVLQQIRVMKGIHKLKIQQKKQRLIKLKFTAGLKEKGFSHIPKEFKFSSLSSSFHFYDPVPKMLKDFII